MPLNSGTLFGPYEIICPIGAGGMGEVYRARDSRLGRDVALKILPASFATDADRLRRFEQEARAVAALNHPNILAVYDIGQQDGAPYLVSELLEGESLRAVLDAGAMPQRKAIECGVQIAHGLAAAHDRNIVHRDLKPENIFVLRDGRVKILDFGLAKLAEPATSDKDATVAQSHTSAGTVLGTAGYMAPEQVRGEPVDARTDIFAFGAVLYEMLSGTRAFKKDTAVETMTAVMREDPPDLAAFSSATAQPISPALDRIVRRCLEKVPDQRFQSAKDLSFALSSFSGNDTTSSSRAALPAKSKSRIAPALIAAALLIATLAAGWFLWNRNPPSTQAKFDRITYGIGSVGEARFTPDGQTIIFDAAWDGGPTRLYQWRRETSQPQSMAMEHVQVVGISKSNELALLINVGVVKSPISLARAPLSGGSPREVLEHVRDATWSPDEQLAAIHMVNGRDRLEYPLGKVLYETAGWLSNPRFSPDGKKIAFLDHTARPDSAGTISIVDLDGKREVMTKPWRDLRGLAWSPSGKEIWFGGSDTHWDALRAVDLAKHERLILDLPAESDIKDIAPDGRVLIDARNNRISIRGRAAGSDHEQDLSWLDISILGDISPDGTQILLGEEDTPAMKENYWVGIRGIDGSPVVRLGAGLGSRFSADGKWVSGHTLDSPPRIFIIPLAAGETKSVPVEGIDRLTGGLVGFFPDGKRIWFNGAQAGHAPRVYATDIDGGTPTPITPEGVLGDGMSDDGKFIVGDGRTVPASSSPTGVALYPIDGGPARLLPGTEPREKFVQWGADGHSMFVRDFALPASVVSVDLKTGKRTPALKLIPGDPAGVSGVIFLSMTRDGKAYAYGFRRALSQLLVVENLR